MQIMSYCLFICLSCKGVQAVPTTTGTVGLVWIGLHMTHVVQINQTSWRGFQILEDNFLSTEYQVLYCGDEYEMRKKSRNITTIKNIALNFLLRLLFWTGWAGWPSS